ncbi:MAG: cation:proton antiporter [Bacteroidota bacterium]
MLMALLILVISSIAIALAIMLILSEPFFNSLVYAIPLSVVSSAVLIPSIHTLTQKKKEFMIYEGTFSDIIGIMFFNFVVLQEGSIFSISGLGNILLTILLSIITSYLMVFFFSRMKHSIKLFLMLAILALLYSIGKKFHLSSLLMIFIFGLVLNNARLFFRSKLKDYLDFKVVDLITKDFKIVTSETAFLVRTFFFVAFGLSINLQVFFEPTVILVGSVIVIILYLVRFINFKLFLKTNVLPEIFLAPRGLITILLFFSIPPIYQIQDFSSGILFFVIISTGLIMMIALMVTPEIKADTVTIIDVDMGSAPFTNSEHVEPTGPYCDIEGFNKDESVPVPQERSSEPARLQDTDRIKFGKKK